MKYTLIRKLLLSIRIADSFNLLKWGGGGTSPLFLIMGTIKQIKDRYVAAYNALMPAIAETVQQTSGDIMALNRDQLLQGRDADGNLISPTYMQDPYFKSQEAAAKYSKMKYMMEEGHKQRMTFPEMYGEKPTDVPNLLVTGTLFFNHFFISVTREAYTIGSTGEAAPDIEQKYNNRLYGLTPKSKEFYYFMFIRPTIREVYGK